MRHYGWLVLAILGGCMVGRDPQEVSADQPLPADLAPGDIVSLGSVSIVVPEPGRTVGAIADLDDGTAVELAIESSPEGLVRLVEAPKPADPIAVTQYATTTECNDGAYNLEGPHWATDLHWYFDAGTTPAANSKLNVETGLENAANAITHSRNSCGFADQVSATNSYGGRTTTNVNMTSTTSAVTCHPPDGKNVVAFGYLPSGVLGITCVYSDASNHITETDIRLSTSRSWFALAVPAGCSNRVGVEQVATHEFGHAFGLAHVSQTTHPELTMSTQARSCSNDKYSLGWGDIRGLRALY